MSYLVLARKWRPQTFQDLIGQEHVSQTLQNAIQSGRVAHAFLFTGARGVGKTSAARILAKALTCEQGPSVEPCNHCPACSEITAGNAVDVIEIDGASNTGVDDVRELRENVKYLPSRLRSKIFIIDEVHMLSTNAFNALLKTLEEPPPHVKFIFATTEPHKVPITILSRCQRFDFRRIAMPTVVARLRAIVDQEGVEVSDASLAMIARKGDGSMRDSLSTLDQVLAFCGMNVTDEDVVTLLGVVDRRLLLTASQGVFDRDCRAVLEVVKQVDSSGYNIRQFCQELVEHFRTITLCCAVGDISGLTDLAEAELAEVRKQSQASDVAELQRHLAILLKAEHEMGMTGFPRLVMEMALLRMAMLAPALPVQEMLSRLDALRTAITAAGGVASAPPVWQRANPPVSGPERQPEKTVLPGGGSAAVKKHPKADSPVPVAAGTVGDWEGFVARVKQEKPMIGSLLEHARPLKVGVGLLELGCPSGSFEFTALNSAANLADLAIIATDYFQGNTEVKLKAVADSGEKIPLSLAEKNSREAEENARRLDESARSNPVVRDALELFGCELGKVEKL